MMGHREKGWRGDGTSVWGALEFALDPIGKRSLQSAPKAPHQGLCIFFLQSCYFSLPVSSFEL